MAFAVLVSTGAVHGAPEDPHMAVMKKYVSGLKRYDGMAGLVQYSVQQLTNTAAAFVESRQMAEIAAGVDRGREVEVYVLYRRVNMPDGGTQDVLQEVSPHPFPTFLREADTQFVVSRKYVVGNGAYLGLGVPPYSGAQDFTPYLPGQTSMRAADDDPETARQYAQWNLYKLTVELWKEQRFEKLPVLQSHAGDADGRASVIFPPRAEAVNEVRESLRRLEMQMDDIEQNVGALQQEFNVAISGQAMTTDALQFQTEIAALRPRLALIRNYLDAVSGMGVTSALTREDTRFYRTLHFLSGQLRERAADYENALAQQRETRLRLAYEQAARETAKRRAAWNVLKAQAGTACADPQKLATMQRDGRVRGIELSHTDFTAFFIEDSTRRIGAMDLVRGDIRLPPSDCQLTLLKAMLEHAGPISITELVQRAEQYRDAHPSLARRLAQGVDAFGKALDQFFSDLDAALSSPPGGGSSGGNSSGRSSSSDTYRERSESSSGTHSSVAPTVDLWRPDFGPGSTLGR